MKELTGADDAVEAWRTFFEPGDVVGIKMNPVGHPLADSSSELMLEVIEGLSRPASRRGTCSSTSATATKFMEAGMHKAVPDGIKWGGLTPENDPQPAPHRLALLAQRPGRRLRPATSSSR